MTTSTRYMRLRSTSPTLTTIPEHECTTSSDPDELQKTGEDPIHFFLNMERKRRGLPGIHRHIELDMWAKIHTFRMAHHMHIFHSVQTVDELKAQLDAEYVGENIQRGDDNSLFALLSDTMDSPTHSVNRSNILSEQFTEFGASEVTGRDGRLYLSMVFRGTARQFCTSIQR